MVEQHGRMDDRLGCTASALPNDFVMPTQVPVVLEVPRMELWLTLALLQPIGQACGSALQAAWNLNLLLDPDPVMSKMPYIHQLRVLHHNVLIRPGCSSQPARTLLNAVRYVSICLNSIRD